MGMDMADLLLTDLRKQTDFLESLKSPMPGEAPEVRQAFAH
jgi:hypothetical protein